MFDANNVDVILKQNIIDYVKKYISLKKIGPYLYKGKSPFTGIRTFFVNTKENTFFDFSSGFGGNIIEFVKKVNNIATEDAIIKLFNDFNLKVSLNNLDNNRDYQCMSAAALLYYNNFKNSAGEKYMQNRHVSKQSLIKFGIGHSYDFGITLCEQLEKMGFTKSEIEEVGLMSIYDDYKGKTQIRDKFCNRVIFPIFDLEGRVVAFGGRALNDNAKAKYLNSPETKLFSKRKLLYGGNFLDKTCDYIIICEGYMDTIAYHEAGFTNAVASLGTALTIEQVQLLKSRTKKVILSYDSDDAGQKATVRAAELFKNSDCELKVLDVTPAKDPDEFIKKFGKEKMEKRINSSIPVSKYLLMNYEKKFGKDEGYFELLANII